MINLPIIAGERPLFQSLFLLQKMHLDYSRNQNVYENISREEIYTYVAKLYAVAQSLRIREEQNRRQHSQDLFDIIKKLPLFFNVEQTYEWENKRPWASLQFSQNQNYITAYTQTLDSSSPSQAYQLNVNGKPEQDYLWEKWFSKTDIKEVIRTLEFSAKKLLNWDKQRKDVSFIFKNAQFFATTLGFEENEANYWIMSLILGSNNWDFLFNDLLSNTAATSNSPSVASSVYSQIFAIWENALELPLHSINNIYKKDSEWVNLNIVSYLEKAVDKWETGWQEMIHYDLKLFNHQLIDHSYIINLFVKPLQVNAINLSNFSYMTDVSLIQKSLTHQFPIRILVHGKQGSGKKTLISSLLKDTNYSGFFPNDNHKKSDDKDSISHIKTANELIKKLEKSALIIEDGEQHLKNITSFNKVSKVTEGTMQFWIVSDLQTVPKEVINKFNFFLDVQHMPIEQRTYMINHYFNDEALSLKIAQSIKTPQEILKLFSWCEATQDKSWNNVSNFLAAFSRAHALSDSLEILLKPVDNHTSIPALAGYPELNELMDKLVNLFTNPYDYQKLGAKPPKGILLVGPPGTGKTHFARHLSRIADIPMFAPDTSYLAAHPELIEKVFLEAQRYSPCILFLDEIDTLITDPSTMTGIDLAKQKIINSFLSQIDGISSNEGILVIGATHRYSNIDKAAVRSGRLSERIQLGIPHHSSRKEIFQAHLVDKKIEGLDLNKISDISKGFSGAEIADVINQAAVLAAQNRQESITMKDFHIACDNVFWGTSDSSVKPNLEEQLRTARHEAGHALLTWKHKLQVNRITLRPRLGSLGAVNWQSDEGIYSSDFSSVVQLVEMMLGGIASEKVFYEHYTNGGSSDLKNAKRKIHDAILYSGLGEFGPVSASDVAYWSDSYKEKLENEEAKIMKEAFQNSYDWLNTHKDLLDEFAHFLLEQKEVSGDILLSWKDKIDNIIDLNLIPASKSFNEQHTLHNHQ